MFSSRVWTVPYRFDKRRHIGSVGGGERGKQVGGGKGEVVGSFRNALTIDILFYLGDKEREGEREREKKLTHLF